MSLFGRIKRTLGFSPTPIQVGHVYVDQITGEPFLVESVGRNVEIHREDAVSRPNGTIRKKELRSAIDTGFVSHEKQRCDECRDDHV